jgi:glucan phosphoethanolaminetransferase (alkaline phosphatase superfamily)
MIAIVIVLLLTYQIGSLFSGLFGMAWGIVTGSIVAAVSFFTTRLAKVGEKRTFWFLLPTLLFTVVPITFMIWNTLSADASWFDRLIKLIPFIIGFGAPLILLLIIYYELRKRKKSELPNSNPDQKYHY